MGDEYASMSNMKDEGKKTKVRDENQTDSTCF